VELALRGRIALEKTGLRRRSLANRKVMCTSETPTGDSLLDEALKHIKDTKPLETTQTWIDYLSGTCVLAIVSLVYLTLHEKYVVFDGGFVKIMRYS